ncbi:molybdenum cofactor guanylyltransferase [Corynebacteriaceae bacterium 6-324]
MERAEDSTLATIIVAGGQGTRMGGVDKASVEVHGVRLVDRLIAQLPIDTDYVVVSPRELGLPATCEQPPFGGPVAGIHAGYEYLIQDHPDIEYLAILPVDAPDSPHILPPLVEAMKADASAGVALIRSQDGSLQNLCALWRTDALAQAFQELGSPRNQSVRRLLAHAGRIIEVPGKGQERDYDTRKEADDYASSAAVNLTRAQLG